MTCQTGIMVQWSQFLSTVAILRSRAFTYTGRNNVSHHDCCQCHRTV